MITADYIEFRFTFDYSKMIISGKKSLKIKNGLRPGKNKEESQMIELSQERVETILKEETPKTT